MEYIDQQRAEQKKWKLWPQFKHLTTFDDLLEHEFIEPQVRASNLHNRLSILVTYCMDVVPYYQTLLSEQQLDIREISSLKQFYLFPILDRASLMENSTELVTSRLPQRQSFGGKTKTSGSTGQPVEVLHTKDSLSYFAILKQREYRSWGFDPSKVLASIRPASDLPKKDGQKLANQTTLHRKGWQYVNSYFQTNEMLMLNDTSGTDYMVDWLNQHQPTYLLAMSAVLEQIAIGYANNNTPSQLTAALAISQQLTESMRNLVVKNTCSRVEQNYGLNEIGIVAMRCPMSGYYHVHNENCLIEIVDENGKPCEPGIPGKLLVTSLINFAMPLLRYDTDDWAELPKEPCPCGRSMQSFTNLRGRYRRTAHLPDGTWDYWDTLLGVFRQALPEEMASIKQYQLHQLSADEFHLKFKVDGTISTVLKNKIHKELSNVSKGSTAKLTIFEMDEIEQTGKKFQNFISDITPEE